MKKKIYPEKDKTQSITNAQQSAELALLAQAATYATEAEELAFCDGLGCPHHVYKLLKRKYAHLLKRLKDKPSEPL